MQIEITAKKENKLLGREEVNFKTLHEKESTPKRDMVREKLAGMFSVKKENVVVDFLVPEFGKNATVGYAKIYKSTEDAKKLEREHILVRNKIIEKAKEKKEEKKTEAKPSAKVEEKKEEAKKEEKPKVEEKKSEKKEEQKVEEKKTEKKTEPKPEAKKEAKPEVKKEEKEAKPETKKEEKKTEKK